MGEWSYKKTTSSHCVFVQQFSDCDFIFLLLYVDDMLIVGRNASRIDRLKKQLSKSFAIKDLEQAKKFLGIRIIHDRSPKKLFLSYEEYIKKVFERFNMDKAKWLALLLLPTSNWALSTVLLNIRKMRYGKSSLRLSSRKWTVKDLI